jgi:hypothetical protein
VHALLPSIVSHTSSAFEYCLCHLDATSSVLSFRFEQTPLASHEVTAAMTIFDSRIFHSSLAVSLAVEKSWLSLCLTTTAKLEVDFPDSGYTEISHVMTTKQPPLFRLVYHGAARSVQRFLV